MAGAGAESGAGSSAGESTWDGLQIATEDPRGSSVVVRRLGEAGETSFLVLHRAANGSDYEGDWAWTSPAGARQPGEAIFPAALRELVEEAAIIFDDVWAVDLSGPWALFACDVPSDQLVDLVDVEHDRFAWLSAEAASARIFPKGIADQQIHRVAGIPSVRLRFRPMTYDDLPPVVDWQRAPHANRWFHGERFNVAAATAKYGPRIEGVAPTRMWVVQVDGRDAGYVQDYRVRDHDEYAVKTQDLDAVAFDYLIGDPALVNKGIGTRMIWTYLRDVLRRDYPEAVRFIASPDHRNAPSLRVLDKCGFSQGLWIDGPESPDAPASTEIVCTLDRARMFGD
jgi:RimJ/RimL family protein N-acetyltransferase/8-oxo-dGTP pyrophosphatase MutT (NUDIX family)